MFHEKVSSGTEGERGDGRVRSEETLVVGVVRDAVGAGGIVVYETEVECVLRVGFDGLFVG